MKVAKGYKQTDIGMIPEEWEVQKLKGVCKLINGRGFKPYEWKKEGLPIIRIQNLNGSEDFNYYNGTFNNKIVVEKGQLLFAWSGSRGTSFGPHIWNGKKALLNYHTWKVNVVEHKIDKEYFLHLLKQLTKQIEEKAHGASALVHTQKGEMENFEFAFPKNKNEQIAIASKLTDTDTLISTLEKQIAKKENLKLATMQLLLSGKKRLKGFSDKWQTQKISDLLDYEQPVNYLVKNTEYHESNGIPVLTANKSFILGYTDEAYGIFDKLPAIIFDDFTTASKYVTFPFKVKSSAIKILKPKNREIDLRFVFEKMQQIKFAIGDHKRYYISEYKNILIEVPTTKEQKAISKVIGDMDVEIKALQKYLSKYKLMKQGMLKSLLTGIIRITNN